MAEPLLEIDDLTVEFPIRRGTVRAVSGLTLAVNAGEIVGVVGESGAGKTSVGTAVIGLLEPPGRIAGGDVRLNGESLTRLSREAMRRVRGRRIGMIFQDPLTSLNPLYTVERQLVETIVNNLDVGEAEARRRAIGLIDQVGIPDAESRIRQYPHQFSGGMRQRVVIALALCGEPDLVIADEPTTALDVSIQAQILELIKRLCKDRGVGVLLITHNMGVIAEITDRVAVMYRSRLVEEGTTHKILSQPDHAYTKSLIAAVPRPGLKVLRFPRVDYIEGDGKPAAALDVAAHWLGRAAPVARSEGPLLSVSDLTMRFITVRSMFPSRRRSLTAVDAVSFDIAEGEVFGLVGESGSGKSTVARMIAGLYEPTAGSIRFAGAPLGGGRARDERSQRRQMQMIFQDPYSSLNPRMRVMDIVVEPIRHYRLASGDAEARAIVHDLLDHVGLGREAALRFPHEFSGGQRQRISIARALATRPRFLICDEPTSALDVSIQAQILNLLKDLQEALGLTILFISHDLPVIRQMCDRVAVMQGGKLCELKATDELFAHAEHPYSQRLLQLMPRLDFLSRDGLEVAPA